MNPEPIEQPSDTAPLFVLPDAADNAARRAADPVKAMPHDPEAPYGYMRDPATGEVRPRKTAGRKAAAPKGRKSTPGPPRNRDANRARAVKAPAAKPAVAPPPALDTGAPPIAAANHAQQVADVIGGVWMMAAAIPTPAPGARIFGMDAYGLTVRTKATVAIAGNHRPALAQSIGTMADHVPMVARGVEWLAREDGPGWIVSAALILLPFVGEARSAWALPIDQGPAQLVAAMDAEFQAMTRSQMAAMAAAAEQARAGELAASNGGPAPMPEPTPA